MAIGSDIVLDEEEELVNAALMDMKYRELDKVRTVSLRFVTKHAWENERMHWAWQGGNAWSIRFLNNMKRIMEQWKVQRSHFHPGFLGFPLYYPPSHSFFDNIAAIEASDVFAFLHEMPKGGVLHVHDISIASIDWVVSNITYR